MMGKFKIDEYRHPWETGPHWELKREFIEAYKDMFEEDRLLCLAQAYSNVVLMNCSYPDQVMRQISELSKPLRMRKKFQEASNHSEKPTSKNEQQRDKMKSIFEQSGRPFKQIKFCASEGQLNSTFSLDSTNLHQSSLEQSNSSYLLPECNEQSILSLISSSLSHSSLTPTLDFETEPQPLFQIKDNIFIEREKEEKIVGVLGLPLIQKMAQLIQKYNTRIHTPVETLQCVICKLGLKDSFSFKIEIDPDTPMHAALYFSKVFIKNCEIASETACSKKKAKISSAEAALSVLVKLSTSNVSFGRCKSYRASHKRTNSMKVLEIFSRNIVNRTKEEPAILALKNIASLVDMEDCILFDIVTNTISPDVTEYTCNFFLNDILISSGKDNVSHNAKAIAVNLGLMKLSSLSEYEIKDGELKKKHDSNINDTSNSVSSSSMIIDEKNNVEKFSFVLNKKLYESSVTDAFVLFEKETVKCDLQKNLRTVLAESASFNHKKFEYQFENVPGTTPPAKKAMVLIGGEVVGTGIGFGKDEAKTLACTKAVTDLKNKYYTIRTCGKYTEGYVITRNQVFDGESYANNVLNEDNIGCKMLKNMGWTGGGLGESGIAEPIEATTQQTLGSGLGFEPIKQHHDLQLFRQRLETMLQEFGNADSYDDLVFSKEFSKAERKEIHRIAGKLHLHTHSRGIDDDRFLIVRQKYNISKLLKHLVKNGGSNSKYTLIDYSETSVQT